MAVATGAEDARRPFRVLICDDERHFVRLLQVNLEHLGHVVDCAFDGAEAIERLASMEARGLP